MTLEEKLGYFSQHTMEQARKNSDSMVETYRAALEQVFEEHKEAKTRMEELEYKTEKERIVRENNKRFSNEQMKLRMTLGRRQAELKEKLFEEVAEQLQRFRKKPEYQELLVRELKEAVAFARKEKVILYVDPSDAERIPELEAAVGVKIAVSDSPFVGGTRALIPGRNILIDNSFETKLKEARERVTIRPGKAAQDGAAQEEVQI